MISKISKIHALTFILGIVFNLLVLYKLSKLDLFDFFHVLHQTINLALLVIVLILLFSQITLYSLFFKLNRDRRIEQLAAKKARIKIDNDNKNILKAVNDLTLLVKNKVINHISLKEKLSNVLKSVNFDDNFTKNALFNSIFDKIFTKVADNYVKFKTEGKEIDYFSIKEILKELKNILSANEDFKIDVESILDLAKELLNDFKDKKNNKKNDTKDLILDYAKVLVTFAYNDYSDNQKEVVNNDITTILQDVHANHITINK